MKLQSFQYNLNAGWSIKSFPDLDSENTLILVFAAPEFIENSEAIKELAAKYPKSKMVGCSSAGEISGAYILDKSLSVAIVKFEKTTIQIVKKHIENMQDSFTVGEEIAKELNKKDLRGIFVLSEG